MTYRNLPKVRIKIEELYSALVELAKEITRADDDDAGELLYDIHCIISPELTKLMYFDVHLAERRLNGDKKTLDTPHELM